ncbi:MAG: hypothetical protein QXM75_03110 [Candidatus Diapherotrites archaeon]
MPELIEIIKNVVFSIFDLLKGSLPFAIVFFFLVLIAKFMQKKFQERFKASWFMSALMISFIFSLVGVFLAYLLPYMLAAPLANLGEIPDALKPEPKEVFNAVINAIFKIILLSIFLAFLTVPFIFLGSFICKVLEAKKFNKLFALFVSVYICTATAISLFFMFIPQIFIGTVYFLYSG